MRAATAALAVLLTACGPGDRTSGPGGLPPAGQEPLIEELQPLVERFGLRMTRAALIDVEGDYQPSSTGRHLALYAVPTEEASARRYLRTLVPLTAALVDVFDRWPGLRSFDICQEPVDATAEPPEAVTRVNVPRTAGESITWETIDLPNLLARSLLEPAEQDTTTLQVDVFGGVLTDPRYRAALAEARRIADDLPEGS